MAKKINSGLAINNEVIAKIAGMAAMEIDGVDSLGRRPVELKNVKSALSGSRNDHSTAVGVVIDNGAIMLDVFIKIRDDVKLKTVAEDVQKNVKDKVQTMTGNAVARVNVHVDDVSATAKND
jgi:uncharacterized alkaline shock family protein YloU